jgi:hypothetical protein
MDIKVNTSFRKTHSRWRDSRAREDHILDRMIARGIGYRQIREAVQKGSKSLRKDGSIISEFRWFKVVYRELRFKGIRKIYPITVVEV